MQQQSLLYHLLTVFTENVETALGRRLGVDEHLRLQELIARLPDDLPPDQLRDVLLPLFAKNEAQQAQLRQLFDECIARAGDLYAQEEYIAPAAGGKRLLPFAIGAILLLLAVVLVWRACPPPPPPPETAVYYNKSVYTGEKTSVCPENLSFTPEEAFFCTENALPPTAHAQYTVSNGICLEIVASDSAGVDTVCLTLRNANISQNIRWIITVEKGGTAVQPPQDPKELRYFPQKSLPFPNDHVWPEADTLAPWERFLARYEWPVKATVIALLTLAGLWFLRWRIRRRRKLVAELESNTLPPYVWNIRIENLEPPEHSEAYFEALQRLRRREEDDQLFLDLPATIGATIENGGNISFRFGRFTRPPEYLLLIDRQDNANHRARLFDQLYRDFKNADVLVERFFFDGDMRRCSNEQYPGGLTLPELQHRYPDSRLLIISDGYQLLSPMTGRLSRWTDFLLQWKQRSLLSPVPTNEWGRREDYLGTVFNLMPASLQGLNFLIEQLDAGEDADWGIWRGKITDAPAEPVELQGGLITTLRYYFSERMMQWIAACAVYPSLCFR